jgi:hypothetical protein
MNTQGVKEHLLIVKGSVILYYTLRNILPRMLTVPPTCLFLMCAVRDFNTTRVFRGSSRFRGLDFFVFRCDRTSSRFPYGYPVLLDRRRFEHLKKERIAGNKFP